MDVAHLLAKHLAQPLPAKAALAKGSLPHGAHPFEDRDEVHEIYAEWRQVFNEYTPPRIAVAEAWVHASRRTRYASPTGLGQAFNFDLLRADWNADQLRDVITHNLAEAKQSGASCTWVLSNHDVVDQEPSVARYVRRSGGLAACLRADGEDRSTKPSR